MKTKQKIKQITAGSVLLLGAVFVSSFMLSDGAFAATCGGANTSIISCPDSGTDVMDTGVGSILKIVILILTTGVGIAAVGGIVWGSLLYASAGGEADKVKRGIEVIRNTVIGLALYVFMGAIMNFLIPGGIIG